MSDRTSHWHRRGLIYALAGFVATRVLVFAFACTAPQDRSRPKSPIWWSHIPTMRWDAGHYGAILQTGYPRENGRLPDNRTAETVAFFPLYPLMARPLTRWMSADAALVLLTHIASLTAMVFLYLWARKRYDARAALWCVLLVCFYPAAMFFSTGYADGLLVMWVAMALWLLEGGRIWPAAVVSALATATRPTGLCLAAIVILWAMLYGPRPARPARRTADEPAENEAGRKQSQGDESVTGTGRSGGTDRPRWMLRTAAIGLVCVSGLIAFQLYLWHHYGRADAFFAVQGSWESRHASSQPLLRLITLKPIVPPAFKPIKYTARGLFHIAAMRPGAASEQFARLRDPETWNPFFNLVLVLLGMAGLLCPGRIPRVLYLLPILVILEAWLPDPYRGGRLIGIARYQLIALPSFLLAAAWLIGPRRAPLRYAVCAGMLTLQCVYIRLFADWRMVG